MSEHRLTALAAYRALSGPHQSLVRMVLIDGIDPLRACSLLGLSNPSRTWNSPKIQAVRDAYGTADIVDDYVARLEAARLVSPDPVPFIQQPGPHTVDTFQSPELPQSFIGGRPAEHGTRVPPNSPETAQPEKCQFEGCDRTECGTVGDEKLCHRHICQRLGIPAPVDRNPPAPAPVTRPYDSPGRIVAPVVADQPIVLGGTDSGIDPKDLFPGINQQLTKGGPSTADLWRGQQSAEEAERESLITQYREQEAAREAQNDRDILYSPRPIGRR